jgi:hypothetical protein
VPNFNGSIGHLRYSWAQCGDCQKAQQIAPVVVPPQFGEQPLIALIARRCTGHVFLWTHYYDRATISTNSTLAEKFTDTMVSECAGFQHELYRYEYQDALKWSGFCGGNAPFSCWMTREGIIECLRFFGFHDFRVGFDDRHHLHGPAFAIVAKHQFRPNPSSVL